MSARAAASVGAGLGEPPGMPTLLAPVGTLSPWPKVLFLSSLAALAHTLSGERPKETGYFENTPALVSQTGAKQVFSGLG